jgi:Kef-type K+ transport system membrane component KefB
MNEPSVLVFLLALASMLALARLLGELGRARGLPAVAGEIAAGIVLGPTVLGRIAPSVHAWLFRQGPSKTMIDGYTTVALLLLVVTVGLELDLGLLRRRAGSAMLTGLLGILLPGACGAALGFLLPDADLVDPSRRVTLAMVLAVALSLSALPVIAKTLLDLGLFKSDVGLLVMSASIIDDLVGWIALSVLLGHGRGHGIDVVAIGVTLGLAAAFAAAMLVGGRRIIDAALLRIERTGAAAPGRVLSMVILLALLGSAATQAVGLHAVFGGFVVGLTVGGSTHLRERTRVAIEDFVVNIFAPVFFASIGLRVDLIGAFDLRLCLLVLVAATVPKLLGCALGARWVGLGWRQAAAVGFGMNARGAMGIILAELARDAGVLTDRMFVALVLMALATSLVSGPAMTWFLYRDEGEEDVVTLLRRGAFVGELHATTPSEAIGELVRALGSLLAGVKRAARDAVLERELVAPTGLGDEVAIPHAAVEGLKRPLLAMGRAPRGIDFDAPDGRAARFVFLLLIPPRAFEDEVRILASIARATFDARARENLATASGLDEVTRVLGESARRTIESQRPKPAGARGAGGPRGSS